MQRKTSVATEDLGENQEGDVLDSAPVISMVTNHTNGTLNLWQLTFDDKSKFSQVEIFSTVFYKKEMENISMLFCFILLYTRRYNKNRNKSIYDTMNTWVFLLCLMYQ